MISNTQDNMDNKNKTAVEWLEQALTKIDQRSLGAVLQVFEQAKQMEKNRLEQCWNVAYQAGRFEGKGIAQENWQTFKEYYEEQYGRK